MNITKKLNEFIENKDKEMAKYHQPLKKNEFFVTQSGLCMRHIWYIKKYGWIIDIDTKKLFYMGTMIHEFFQTKILDKNIYKFEQPIQIKTKKILIRGRIDAISYENEILELKSCMFLPKEPDEKYKSQIILYMSQIQNSKGKLIYISKNDLQIKEFDIDFDLFLYNEILGKFEHIFDCLQKNILPNKEPVKYCKYCDFADKCQGDKK